jgi:hypothetical protein
MYYNASVEDKIGTTHDAHTKDTSHWKLHHPLGSQCLATVGGIRKANR